MIGDAHRTVRKGKDLLLYMQQSASQFMTLFINCW